MRFDAARHYLVIKHSAGPSLRSALRTDARDSESLLRVVVPSLHEAREGREVPGCKTGDRYLIRGTIHGRSVVYSLIFSRRLAHDGAKRCVFLEGVDLE